MKVKSFLLTALAASMTFVACDNKDDEMGQLDNTPKSVSIDLSNVIPVTRGAGQEVEDNSKVSLTDLQVFFTDGTTLYKGKTIEGTEATHYFSNKSNFDDRTDKVFHFLPAEVNKVIVVGNNGSKITEATTYADLQKKLAIAEQQDPQKLDLYKEVELTSVEGQDDLGHPLYKSMALAFFSGTKKFRPVRTAIDTRPSQQKVTKNAPGLAFAAARIFSCIRGVSVKSAASALSVLTVKRLSKASFPVFTSA